MALAGNVTVSYDVSNVTYKEAVPSGGILIAFLLLVCIWIIVINALVFTCLLMSRHALKNFVNIQMLSFSLTDFFVGVCAIPVTLTYQITTAFPYFEACAGIFYGYCISQTANLLHAFGICIHRIVIIKRCAGRKETNPDSMLMTLLLQILMIWVLSVFLVSIPFGLYGRFGEQLNECSLNTLFGDNYIKFVAIMDFILIIPQVGMNVVYVYMFRFLFTTWKGINSKRKQLRNSSIYSCREMISNGSGVDEITTENTSKNKILDFNPDKNCSRAAGQTITIKLEIPTNESSDACCSGVNIYNKGRRSSLTTVEKIDREQYQFNVSRAEAAIIGRTHSGDGETLYLRQLKRNWNFKNRKRISNDYPSQISGASFNSSFTVDKNKKHFSGLHRKASNYRNSRKMGYRSQKDVLITIGLILLVVNVFMTPLNLLVIIELISHGFLTRKVKFVFMAFALMNSVLNPIIYALRIKPFRNVFVRNSKTCIRLCLSKHAAEQL